MSEKDESEQRPDLSKPLGSETIDELYRLAEILMGPSEFEGSGPLSRRRVAKLRMEELLQSLNAPEGSTSEVFADHKWVLDVLQDLSAYAEERDLAELHRILVDARFLAFRVLKKG